MSFPTDWDVEKYRVGYESEEHWDLRKKFLVTHKNKYPEDKLVCLAQVFYNVEFMGCRYPKVTMKMVEKLSKGIVEDHREKMKSRLKRTFVGASDAASSKVKGLKCSAAADLDKKSDTPLILPSRTSNEQPVLSKFITFASAASAAPVSTDNTVTEEPTTTKNKKKKKKSGSASSAPAQHPPSPELITSTPTTSSFKDIVLYYREHETFKDKLISTCTFSKVSYELTTEFQQNTLNHKSCVKMFEEPIGFGIGITPAAAQEEAAKTAISFLTKQCYTILVKNVFVVDRKVERHEIIDCPASQSSEAEVVQDDKASRMMKMMGWSGGGLGKEEQGRTEPVMPVHQSRRAGVGSKAGHLKFDTLKNIFQEFIKNGSTHDIVFSTDFDNAERKEIHTIAHRLGLKSLSRAKGDNRFLTVSRKWLPHVLLMVLKDARNKSEKYQLLPPNPEAVTAEEQRYQTEKSNFRAREKENAENGAKEKRARSDIAVNCHQYQTELEKLREEIKDNREAAINAEMNYKLLAAVRDQVAQKELELAELCRNKQWASQAGKGSTAVNEAIKNQITVDLEQIVRRVQQAKKDFIALAAKRAEASKIINEVRAYILTEENAKLEMELRVKAMNLESNTAKEMASGSGQKQVRVRQVGPSSPKDTNRLALLKELEEEKIRGGKLTKELCEMTMLAAAKAAKRKQWLEKHFPKKDEQATVVNESPT